MAIKNLLLARLPDDMYARIEPDLELASLSHGKVLHRQGEEISDLYFPTTCMISITVTILTSSGSSGNCPCLSEAL
jgi:hypothetical protein